MPPFVSVVVPLFNSANFVEHSLNSVLGLDYPRDCYELVMVDDGSTDDTNARVSYLLEGSDVQWALISQENRGAAAARNAGLELAKGEWIQFLDSDDLIHPQKFKIQLARIPSLDSAMVYSPYDRMQQGVRGKSITPSMGDEPLISLITTEGFVPTGSQLYRKESLVAVGGFNEAMRLVEDVNLNLRLVERGYKLTLIESESALFTYVDRSDSTSKADHLDFSRSCVKNAKFVQTYFSLRRGDLGRDLVDASCDVYRQALCNYSKLGRDEYWNLRLMIEELDPNWRQIDYPYWRWFLGDYLFERIRYLKRASA
ncbi:MAG: glycosyltransferase family 2 protein [Pseudomonadales bacterium]|nr:glycosyltransferase family 2 protein [Pseudomonadales bacterium]